MGTAVQDLLQGQEVRRTVSQKTIRREALLEGHGLHTGQAVRVCFLPGAPNTGILFERMDLPTPVVIPADVDSVYSTPRNTQLAKGSHTISTVEHALSAIRALDITNLRIQVWGEEMPAGDGSSSIFLEILENAGFEDQKQDLQIANLKTPIYHSEGDTHLVALPSDVFKISYLLDYPNTPTIGTQYLSLDINESSFKEEIAKSRTFCLYQELEALKNAGLIKGGSLKCAILVKDDEVLCSGGLRYPNEMVRHKILDLWGDLALVGTFFNAHVISIRSGHRTNAALAKKIRNHIKTENSLWRF